MSFCGHCVQCGVCDHHILLGKIGLNDPYSYSLAPNDLILDVNLGLNSVKLRKVMLVTVSLRSDMSTRVEFGNSYQMARFLRNIFSFLDQ